MNPHASSRIFFFFVPLLAVICFVAEAVSDEDDEADLKALDERRTSSLRPSDGYLVDWDVIGPFSEREENDIGFAVVDVGEFTDVNSVQHAGRKYFWTPVIAKNGAALVDLSREFGLDAEGMVYAAAEVYVNWDMNATIRVETNDEIACWVNGKALNLKSESKKGGHESVSPIRLRMGHNKVVIGLRHRKGKWSFGARVLDEAGEPIDPRRLRIMDDRAVIHLITGDSAVIRKHNLPVEIQRP